jgi:hypothetical protein
MKRIIAAVAIVVLATTGCTSRQYLRYVSAVLDGHKVEADAAALQYEAERAADTAGRPCAVAYDAFREAGFARSQWPTMSALCWRESRGSLNAVSPTHDYCWWQINRSAHQSRLLALGIIRNGMSDLLTDEQACADAAFDVWSRAGYPAWATY